MRAVVIREHGGPEVLRVEERPVPDVGPNDIRVRVRAVALNHLDLWTRRGIPGVRLPLPIVPGADVAGVVDAVGDQVRHVKPGDAVVLHPAVSCGVCRFCLQGEDNRCREYKVLGHRRDGGCADFIVVPAVNALPKPAGLTWEEAASMPLVFLTAWHMLVTLARLRPAETVLVMAAGSGVGIAAVQVARMVGARVIATAGTEAKRQRLQALGADHVVDHYDPAWPQRVLELTHRAGVDVVFEHVGEAVWDGVLQCLGWGGRLVTCGATTGTEARLNLRALFAKQWRIYGSYMGTRGELLALWPLVERGVLRPVVDRVFPLEEAAQAHAYMESRQHFGKVVLRVSTDP